MRNRVKIVKTKFHVDTENKVVVCELECDMQMSKHPAWRVIDNDMWSNKFPKINWSNTFTVKAVARCNATDTFDERTGRMIAEGRAKAKMFKIASQVWDMCDKALTKLASECAITSLACVQARTAEGLHVLKLI